jgi:hypothetical protein
MKELNSNELKDVSAGEGPLRELGREVGAALRDAWDWLVS